MNFGYIYKSTNLINGMQYIGKKTLSEFDPNYFGSGILLKKALDKYGRENFKVELLEWCEDNNELNDKEKYYIELNDAYKSNDFYNIASGGEGGNTYAGKSEEEMKIIKEKISKANLGERNGNKGQYRGPLNSMYGKKQTMEARKKISESLKKCNTNKSHKWTTEMNEKRTKTLKRFKRFWEVIDNSTNNVIYNFTNKIIWLNIYYPELYKSISKLEKLELYREGILIKNNFTIKVKTIDMENIDEAELNYYVKYYEQYKQFIHDNTLLKLKQQRILKRINKV